MAEGLRALMRGSLPAVLVITGVGTAIVVALTALVLAGLAADSAFMAAFDGYMARVAAFTLMQAAFSTVLSVAPAILVARALHAHADFPGRALVLRLFALPLALPALIAALGLLALLGRNGLAAPVLSHITGERWPGIYGLEGILLAHVFFNLPLAARLFLTALDSIPADQWRNARQLDLPPVALFRLIEWPALRAALPGVALMVFLLCATSFTLVLILGGGPQATTIEVAVYQALRFDFDPARASALALLQLAIAAGLGVVATRMSHRLPMTRDASHNRARPRATAIERALNATALLLAVGLVAAPVIAILARGISAPLLDLLRDPAVIRAAVTSLAVAAPASFIAVAASIALLSARAPALQAFAQSGGGMLLAVSPVVLGAGWFLALRPVVDPFAAAPVIVVLANALLALPFALRLLAPGWMAGRARHDRLCASLGLTGWRRLHIVEGRALFRPLVAALMLAALLSLGDLGVIALFGSDTVQTLPALLHARLGSYRTDDAAGLAFLLTISCLALLWMADRLSEGELR
jgi:thiamine transport system permease protein